MFHEVLPAQKSLQLLDYFRRQCRPTSPGTRNNIDSYKIVLNRLMTCGAVIRPLSGCGCECEGPEKYVVQEYSSIFILSQDKHQMVFNIEIGGEGNSKRGQRKMVDIEME
jgi:hypothetical protein